MAPADLSGPLLAGLAAEMEGRGEALFPVLRAAAALLRDAARPRAYLEGQQYLLKTPGFSDHLAELLRKEPATVARLLDRLVKRGLVQRKPNPKDRRANIVENTPDASKLLVEIQPAVVARASQIAEGISDDDLAVFFDVLDRVRHNASKVMAG